MVPGHLVNLPFCQLAILSNCHFVNLPFCQLANLAVLWHNYKPLLTWPNLEGQFIWLLTVHITRELLLKGKVRYSRPPCLGSSFRKYIFCIKAADLWLNIFTIVICNLSNSGLYYKHVMIVNYTFSSLARVVNYNHRLMPQFGVSL
jgi:hypothetical protein